MKKPLSFLMCSILLCYFFPAQAAGTQTTIVQTNAQSNVQTNNKTNVQANSQPIDQEVLAALKKKEWIGKANERDFVSLFGQPVSVVENAHSKVYAYKLSAVIKGLNLTQSAQPSQATSLSSVSQKSREKEIAQKSKGNKSSVDKIINFSFRDNKLLSYKLL